MKCQAKNSVGKPCGARSVRGEKRCIMHSGRAAELGSKGGRRRTLYNPDNLSPILPPKTVADVRDLFAQLIVEVRSGKMDPKPANSISYLGLNFLRTLETAETASPFQPPVGGTMKKCYKARWLIETENQLAQELEQEYAGLLTPEAVRNFIAQFLQQATSKSTVEGYS
jgi:hypothetical protein